MPSRHAKVMDAVRETAVGASGELQVVRITQRRDPPDVLKTLFYRPELFGSSFSAACQAVLRGPSEWSVGERELFAAFTSAQNQCPF